MDHRYDQDAEAIIGHMERLAASEFSTGCRSSWPTYTTDDGVLEVRLSRGGFELWLDGIGTNRARALRLIAQRMRRTLEGGR